MKANRVRKFNEGKSTRGGGISRPAALERRRQQEYLERNPQYREREEGLESVSPERFLIPGGAARTGAAGMLGMAGRSTIAKKIKRKYERNKDALGEAAGMGVLVGGGALAQAVINRLQTEQLAERRARAERERAEKAKEEKDKSSYRKGGSVKLSASRRADGIAKKGKTRGTCK